MKFDGDANSIIVNCDFCISNINIYRFNASRERVNVVNNAGTVDYTTGLMYFPFGDFSDGRYWVRYKQNKYQNYLNLNNT